MQPRTRIVSGGSSPLLPLAAAVLAVGIFVADTLTSLEIAVPVFYTAVVLLSVRICSRRSLVFVAAGCVGLTLASDLLTPQTSGNVAGAINTSISILAIVSTTYLALKIEASEREANDARAQLAHIARLTALGELTASLAHEVNQPIAASVANASASLRWLAADPPNLNEARAAIERIVTDASRAGSIVARIRGLVKRAPAKMVPCQINEVIRSITELVAAELEKRRITLRTELEPSLPEVSADPIQLQQVMLNLIMNAMEAMESQLGSNRSLLIRSTADAFGVAVRVRDSGPGLPEGADKERLFAAFYSTKVNGMGLGLAITRSIVESHGGRIWAESQKSPGAIFCFKLPAIQSRA